MSAEQKVDGRRSAAVVRRRERERQILAATRALFDERGVRDAQIEDIAKAVGTNRAIIYRHFSGKEELFALTLVGYLEDLRELLDKVAESHTDPMDRLVALVSEFVDFGLEFPAFIDCAQTLMRRPGDELFAEISEGAMFRLGRALAACLRVVTATLDAGVEQGTFRIADTDLLANHLYASGLGALQLARVGIIVKEAAPGVPTVQSISPEQVKKYLVASCQALAVTN